MSINVVVSSTAAGVSVSGGTAVSIEVGGGIGPAGFVMAPGTATNAFGTFQLTAGDGITISTSASQFQVASYSTAAVASFAPVQSVAGRVGNVVLQAADVTAGTFAIARIPTISYTALSNAPTSFAPSAHTHSTADVVSFTAAAAAAAPVQSVAGRTGAISLAVADVSGLAAVASSGSYTSLQNVPATFAPSAHTHSTADITGLSSSFAAAGHTHDAAAISSGVLELARIPTIGYTALAGVPATFAPQAHTHSTADVVGLTASFSQIGHTHDYAATIHTHSLADITQSSATAGQVPTWNGTAWAAATPSGGGGSYTLPTASSSVLGGVKVGSGLTITDGVLSRSSNYDPAAAPGAPSGVTYDGAAVSWNPSPGGVATYYEVQWIDVTGNTYATASNNVSGTSLTYSYGGSGTRKFRVRGYNADSLPGEWGYQEGAPGGGGGGSGLAWSSVPASATATGAAGSIAYDHANGFFYVATATDSWKRAAIAAWDSSASDLLLLMRMDGSAVDISSRAVSFTSPPGTFSTTRKFGSNSYSVNGQAGFTSTSKAVPDISTGDWTVEAWVYRPTANDTYANVIFLNASSSTSSTASGGLNIYINQDGSVVQNNGLAGSISGGSVSVGVWTHIAVVMSSGVSKLYINGTSVATGSQQPSAGPYWANIGWVQSSSPTFASDLLIDELRITKAARYTANFTPPTAAFPAP